MLAHAVPSTPLDVDTALQEGALGNRFPFLGTLKALAGIGLSREVLFSTRQWGTGIAVKGRGEVMTEGLEGGEGEGRGAGGASVGASGRLGTTK